MILVGFGVSQEQWTNLSHAWGFKFSSVRCRGQSAHCCGGGLWGASSFFLALYLPREAEDQRVEPGEL